MDKIFIKALTVPALIGVLPDEQKSPQNLLIDLEMSTDIRLAAKKDDINETIDYAAVRIEIIEFIEQSYFNLVETMAEHLSDYLHQRFNFSAIVLRITKKPVDMPDAQGVGVIIEREYI